MKAGDLQKQLENKPKEKDEFLMEEFEKSLIKDDNKSQNIVSEEKIIIKENNNSIKIPKKLKIENNDEDDEIIEKEPPKIEIIKKIDVQNIQPEPKIEKIPLKNEPVNKSISEKEIDLLHQRNQLLEERIKFLETQYRNPQIIQPPNNQPIYHSPYYSNYPPQHQFFYPPQSMFFPPLLPQSQNFNQLSNQTNVSINDIESLLNRIDNLERILQPVLITNSNEIIQSFDICQQCQIKKPNTVCPYCSKQLCLNCLNLHIEK